MQEDFLVLSFILLFFFLFQNVRVFKEVLQVVISSRPIFNGTISSFLRLMFSDFELEFNFEKITRRLISRVNKILQNEGGIISCVCV